MERDQKAGRSSQAPDDGRDETRLSLSPEDARAAETRSRSDELQTGGRRLYTLVNPSDSITFRATPLEACFIADRMLAGPYFVNDAETEEAPEAPDDLKASYEALWSDAERIKSYAEAYASFLVASPGDRALYEEIIASLPDDQRRARRDKWHDERCTSMNDICRQCWETANKLAAYKPEVAA